MKNILFTRFKTLLLIILSAALVQACDRVYPVNDATGSMAVSVSLAAVPSVQAEDFSFNIDGDGPGEASFHAETTQGEGSALIEGLAFGSWVISVEALYHGGSGAASFGDGTASVDVHPSSTSSCSVAITPFSGQGQLNLTVNWNSASVENPALEGTLSRVGHDPAAVNFTMGSGQATSSMTLDSGIYTFSLVLRDGEAYEFSGVADSIRITNALTTSAAYTLTGASGQGAIDISISISIPSEIDALITGGPETNTIPQGTAVALAGSAQESGDFTYSWYLNGRIQQNGSSYTIPGTLEAGIYRVDLIVYNSDYTRCGSATYSFTVVE